MPAVWWARSPSNDVSAFRSCALALIGLLVLPAVASAHALLISSNPPPGAGLAGAPPAITAMFSEPLNRPLSSLKLTTAGGAAVRATVTSDGETRLVLRPLHRLARGVYELRWRTVSADDGHTAEGSYSFGVRAPVRGAAESAPAGPLAAGGWWRALLDAVFDGALILFCGGVFCSALLSARGEPGAWLLPDGRRREIGRRQWRVTIGIGAAAVVCSLVATLADAAHAGGGISTRALHAYFLSDAAGYARLAVPAMLLASVVMAMRGAPGRASAPAVLALAAVAAGGHASSAHLSGVAFASDLVHLIAASVWLGGIVNLAIAWVPRLRELGAAGRRQIVEVVLPRFGRVALPAFITLVIAGAVNAATELGTPRALWTDGYGRVLLVKTALVGVVAMLSYKHALRLRPRLLASRDYDLRLERRHWQLLASEPILGTGIVLAAALLVAYAPPIDLSRALALASVPAGDGARHFGAGVAALGSRGGGAVHRQRAREPRCARGQRRAADAHRAPEAGRAAGSCSARRDRRSVRRRLHASGAPGIAGGASRRRGGAAAACIACRFRSAISPGASATAQRILTQVERAERQLRSVAIHETLGSGTGPPEVTYYQVGMPDRFAYSCPATGGR